MSCISLWHPSVANTSEAAGLLGALSERIKGYSFAINRGANSQAGLRANARLRTAAPTLEKDVKLRKALILLKIYEKAGFEWLNHFLKQALCPMKRKTCALVLWQ